MVLVEPDTLYNPTAWDDAYTPFEPQPIDPRVFESRTFDWACVKAALRLFRAVDPNADNAMVYLPFTNHFVTNYFLLKDAQRQARGRDQAVTVFVNDAQARMALVAIVLAGLHVLLDRDAGDPHDAPAVGFAASVPVLQSIQMLCGMLDAEDASRIRHVSFAELRAILDWYATMVPPAQDEQATTAYDEDHARKRRCT